MRLPDEFEARRFADWNFLLRGLVEVWELASLMGWEEELERMLVEDHDCVLVELLGRIGNDYLALAGAVLVRRQVVQSENEAPVPFRLRILCSSCSDARARPANGALAACG